MSRKPVVPIRFAAPDLDRLRASAARQGKPLSEYLRELVHAAELDRCARCNGTGVEPNVRGK